MNSFFKKLLRCSVALFCLVCGVLIAIHANSSGEYKFSFLLISISVCGGVAIVALLTISMAVSAGDKKIEYDLRRIFSVAIPWWSYPYTLKKELFELGVSMLADNSRTIFEADIFLFARDKEKLKFFSTALQITLVSEFKKRWEERYKVSYRQYIGFVDDNWSMDSLALQVEKAFYFFPQVEGKEKGIADALGDFLRSELGKGKYIWDFPGAMAALRSHLFVSRGYHADSIVGGYNVDDYRKFLAIFDEVGGLVEKENVA